MIYVLNVIQVLNLKNVVVNNMKLIKINESHYIIYNDSEIKEGLCYNPITGELINLSIKGSMSFDEIISKCKKITHSTQPLEENGEELVNGKWIPAYVFGDDVERFSLSEAEELTLGCNVEKIANLHCEEQNRLSNSHDHNSFIEGFKTHRQLVKDKLFTIKQINDLVNSVLEFMSHNEPSEFDKWYQRKLQNLLPKTEWDIKFDEQDKLKLI